MSLIRVNSSPVVLRLNRDLVRLIKRGDPWVYAEALRELPAAPSGTPAVLLDNKKGLPIARGVYDPSSPLALRICETDPDVELNQRWAERRMKAAIAIRRAVAVPGVTTGYRLFNGEGDGLPGLVVDRYREVAVMKLDGNGPRGFWNVEEAADWIAQQQSLSSVYERQKERGAAGSTLFGAEPSSPVQFLEHGLTYTADVVRGQKTGFFLDQRENRQLVRNWSRDARVLNLFSYTGGFSIAAGAGGASHVTSVDVASAAIEAANEHWRLNGLPDGRHEGIVSDAFEFLEDTAKKRQRWDVVILDPPSFAPNRESVSKAVAAYQQLIESGTRATGRQGILAAASCSSHIDMPLFLQCCEEGLSKARRTATVLSIMGQPVDHPSPIALPAFRYLKFVLMRLN